MEQRKLTDKELLDRIARCEQPVRHWALQEGLQNLEGHIEAQGAIAAQAATTLALLLAGIGGSLAYAVKLLEPGAAPAVARGAAALCAYLMVLTALVVWRCLNTRPSPALHNHPANLLVPGADLASIQAGELLNVQRRIEQQIAITAERARWLNGVRLLAPCSPIVFAAAALA